MRIKGLVMESRRQFLIGVTSVSTATTAGCSTNNDVTAEKETEATGPEEVVKQMGTAVAEGNYESANEFIHPDAPRREYTERTANIVEQKEVEEVSPYKEGYIEQVAKSTKKLDRKTIQSIDNDVQQAVTENGFDEYSIVLSSSKLKNESLDHPVWVIKVGGEWYVWI